MFFELSWVLFSVIIIIYLVISFLITLYIVNRTDSENLGAILFIILIFIFAMVSLGIFDSIREGNIIVKNNNIEIKENNRTIFNTKEDVYYFVLKKSFFDPNYKSEEMVFNEVAFETKDQYLLKDIVKIKYTYNEQLSNEQKISEIKRAAKQFEVNKVFYDKYQISLIEPELKNTLKEQFLKYNKEDVTKETYLKILKDSEQQINKKRLIKVKIFSAKFSEDYPYEEENN